MYLRNGKGGALTGLLVSSDNMCSHGAAENVVRPSCREHYGTLLRLKQHFPFSLIDAMGPLDDCRRQIQRELRYQSSMDLDEHTYAAIRYALPSNQMVIFHHLG